MNPFSSRTTPDRRVSRIEINRIHPSPFQPRKCFDEADLQSLADSIGRFGLLSPLLVRKSGGDYELIAGERRLRALQLLGSTHADAIITAAFDRDCALIGLIENLQREDLHFLDEAEACRRILRENGLKQEELAASLGKSPSALANLLRLLRLSRDVRSCIRDGGLSERHARALLCIDDETRQLSLARRTAQERLSVRELEDLARQHTAPQKAAKKPAAPFMRDNRLVINALKDTVRQLRRIGVSASSRVEDHGDHYDVIVTVQMCPQAK